MSSATEPVVFSAAEAYFAAAAAELRQAFPGAELSRLGPDSGRLLAEGAGIAAVAAACRDRPIVFVRHLLREAAQLPAPATPGGGPGLDVAGIVEAALPLLRREQVGPQLALQVWRSGASQAAIGERTDELWRELAARLTARGFVVARGGRAWILSLLLTPSEVILGLNRREDALVDWPGGRVGLAHRPEQISRAEFKLEELVQVFDIALPPTGRALDLGASPGGWTRILRRFGLEVWAIDPGALDPRLAADPAIHHVASTAAPFLAETTLSFDVVADDMRMPPAMSCRLMLAAARRLKPDGLAIVTLKILPREALGTVRQSLALLEQGYEISHARQLFHNRNEITVVARRKRLLEPRPRPARSLRPVHPVRERKETDGARGIPPVRQRPARPGRARAAGSLRDRAV